MLPCYIYICYLTWQSELTEMTDMRRLQTSGQSIGQRTDTDRPHCHYEVSGHCQIFWVSCSVVQMWSALWKYAVNTTKLSMKLIKRCRNELTQIILESVLINKEKLGCLSNSKSKYKHPIWAVWHWQEIPFTFSLI